MRLIDADVLIHELNNSHYPGAPYVDAGISIAIGKVCDAPTIEPERKTGMWIPDNNNYYEERYICSACKRSYKVDTCMGKPIWNYCPCGAKMKEGEQG